MNASPLRSAAPLPSFTPGLACWLVRKALLLSLFETGEHGEEPAMKDLNRVQLIGHLGHVAEVTYTATGTARTTFSVATSTRRKDADGQTQETTEWTRCIAWGTLAEGCAQYVTKGSHIY